MNYCKQLQTVVFKGVATRFCDEHGEWKLPNLINCTNEALVNASSLLDGIIANETQDKFRIQKTVNNTLQLMKHLTSSNSGISAGDLSSSLGVLEKIVTVTNATRSVIEKEVYYAVIDNILSPNNSNSWTTISEQNESTEMRALCVSWDFDLNKWSEEGCTVIQTDRQRTVCQCNHLTNFAILMRPYTQVTEESPFLKTMSLAGVALSIAFTFLTSLIYILTWRSGLRSLGTLLPVLGVTWLFGILAVNENAVVFQYLFVIANSFQGFFIFVSHVLLDKKVRQGIGNRYPSLSTIFSFAERGTKETTISSPSPSTSKSNEPKLIKEDVGCPTPGYYGFNCTIPCPDVNCGYCHIETGTCQGGCIPGYRGHQCELGCPRPGYYGIDCNLPCPDKCRYCHIETGTCQGCKPGYNGHQCELECDKGWYGEGCQRQCGHCINTTQCDHVNGTCSQGCEFGYKSETCAQVCDDHFYGENCSVPCGNCLKNEQCHHLNGTCFNGCMSGFKGSECIEECQDGYFGENCIRECPDKCYSCNKSSGICDQGCHPGWKGTYCTEACSNNTYGLLCLLTCGNCIDKQQCHHVTGKCPEGCAVGFQGKKCDKVQCTVQCLRPSAEPADHPSITYSVSALLAVCVIVIIFLTLRLCKHEQCYKCHQQKQPKDNKPVDTVPSTTGHDVNVDDGTAYQELTEVTNQPQRGDLGHTAVNPDTYVNVEGDNSAYQALGEVTQPSLYDTPFQK
uniref:GAIN-B domain-containing protein n=1 Tax=Magallana gigas TaxID=29159 RepID=A0A8W8P1I7_MAGGI